MLRESEKNTGRRQTVIAMTALVMQGDRERCLYAGMDGYLAKPIRPQELDDMLDEHICKRHAASKSSPCAEPEAGEASMLSTPSNFSTALVGTANSSAS